MIKSLFSFANISPSNLRGEKTNTLSSTCGTKSTIKAEEDGCNKTHCNTLMSLLSLATDTATSTIPCATIFFITPNSIKLVLPITAWTALENVAFCVLTIKSLALSAILSFPISNSFNLHFIYIFNSSKRNLHVKYCKLHNLRCKVCPI